MNLAQLSPSSAKLFLFNVTEVLIIIASLGSESVASEFPLSDSFHEPCPVISQEPLDLLGHDEPRHHGMIQQQGLHESMMRLQLGRQHPHLIGVIDKIGNLLVNGGRMQGIVQALHGPSHHLW